MPLASTSSDKRPDKQQIGLAYLRTMRRPAASSRAGYVAAFKPGDKVVVFQYDGKEFHGVVVLTEVHTSGTKVRVRCGDVVLNVDEKLVTKDD
jgi:hypothetical protein